MTDGTGIELLHATDLTSLAASVDLNESLFVTAVSFEQRCTAAAQALSQQTKHVGYSLVLDYPTSAQPPGQDRQLRARHAAMLEESMSRAPIERAEVHPYAPHPFLVRLEELIAARNPPVVVIDVSCMTRPHVMALGTLLAKSPDRRRYIFSYTVPLNYQVPSTKRSLGWDDVIILPIGEAPLLRREGHARGILLPGHEPDRVSVALSTLEPAAGLILVGGTEGRPDFRATSEAGHEHIFRHLERLRMPADPPRSTVDGWRRVALDIYAFDEIAIEVRSEIVSADRDRAPLIVYPFGPKSLVLAVSLQLAAEYPGRAWAVYPVPTVYDVNYTFGSGETKWLTYTSPVHTSGLPLPGADRIGAPNQ